MTPTQGSQSSAFATVGMQMNHIGFGAHFLIQKGKKECAGQSWSQDSGLKGSWRSSSGCCFWTWAVFQFFNFISLFFKKHCYNLLIYCVTLGREITRFLFFLMLIIEWCFQYALEQAFKMPFVGCCGFFCFVLLNSLANCHRILTPASSALCSLSAINYQNWLEFVLLSSQKEVMKHMLSFVLYEQTFS